MKPELQIKTEQEKPSHKKNCSFISFSVSI